MDSITSTTVFLLGISWKDRMDQGSRCGSTAQRMGNKHHSLGAHEASWIHAAWPGTVASPKGFSTYTAGTCGISGHAAPQPGSLHSSSKHPQNLDQSRGSEEQPDEPFQTGITAEQLWKVSFLFFSFFFSSRSFQK